MIDEYCETFILDMETTFTDAIGQTVSLIALSPKTENIVLHGFQYILDNESLELSNPRGISNIIISSPATIISGSGSLLVVRYWLKDYFPEAD